MLKARNKKISLILVLAMMMTMFAGLGAATAATTTYSCLQAPYLATGSTVSSTLSTMGTLVVDWDTLSATDSASAHKAIIVLPDGLEFDQSAVIPSIGKNLTTQNVLTATILSDTEVQVEVYGPAATEARMLVFFQNVKVTSGAPVGEAKAKILNIQGLFPQGEVTVGTIVGAGAASVSVINTKTITDGDNAKVEFTVQEGTVGGVKKEAKALTFKLPRGFSWVDGTYDIQNLANATNTSGLTFTRSDDKRSLYLNRTADDYGRSLFKVTADVSVDETTADFGDVNVSVSGKNTVNPNTVKIGTYADYGYTVEVKDAAKEILAGRSGADTAVTDEATLSSFTIAENIDASLLNDRTIYMELPQGVQFYEQESKTSAQIQTAIDNAIETSTDNGSITMNFTAVQNKPNMVKGVLKTLSTSKDKIKVEINALVAVDYVGDITLKLSGSAGVDETITLGKAVAPISAKADVVDVKIGAQDQKAGNITITEVKAEALVAAATPDLTLTAPAGVSFSKLPTVKVAEGDLLIGTYTLSRGADGTRNNVLNIPVRSTSDKASTIEVSDITYSLDRTVPEGDMVIEIGGKAVDRADITNRDVAAVVKAANCVTPAPGNTVGNGEFKVGSNIYNANGVAKVMDAAPYIKNARTYVPMRYLAEILGAEVVWDASAQTVTLTKGETTVVFTIGSTTYTVNGEAKTADVAPEIVNDRTMLPARFVAEAFGAVVGWDASTQTVLIQK